MHNVARYFQQTVEEHFFLIESTVSSSKDEYMDCKTSSGLNNDSNYLFADISGDSRLHRSCTRLRNLISRPFANAPQLPDQPSVAGARDANVAERLNWATNVTSIFNGNIRQELRGPSAEDFILSQSLDRIGSGHFIDSQEPHGWEG